MLNVISCGGNPIVIVVHLHTQNKDNSLEPIILKVNTFNTQHNDLDNGQWKINTITVPWWGAVLSC